MIKELSSVGQELNSNGPDVFSNISSIDLVADTLALAIYRAKSNFNLVPDKQKIFTYSFNYFDVDEKTIKKASIYSPYEHFQTSGFTFKHKTNGTYNVKLNKKVDLIE